MAIRKSQAIITALGAALLLAGYFSVQAALKHANFDSPSWATYHPWVDANPITDWDRFWMNLPASVFFLTGLGLLLVALIRATITAATKPPYVSRQNPRI